MSSSNDDRSLASGIPIPQWMRSKTESYGFDPSTLSPPTHEGDFFYIRFPKPQQPEKSDTKTINDVLAVKEQAFNKHTDSCKQFIPKIQDNVQIQKPKVIKPMGVDDGFKGENAACGASVVEVAHQILTGKSKGKPFKPLNRGETEGDLGPSSSYLQQHRDSKSLPASPLGTPESSPLTKKKNKAPLQGLLGVFFQNENLNGSEEEIEKKTGSSWILSSLFASKDKEIEKGHSKEITKRKKDIVNEGKNPINMTVEIKSISPEQPSLNKNTLFKSKPHLRDLNLITPSSM